MAEVVVAVAEVVIGAVMTYNTVKDAFDKPEPYHDSEMPEYLADQTEKNRQLSVDAGFEHYIKQLAAVAPSFVAGDRRNVLREGYDTVIDKRLTTLEDEMKASNQDYSDAIEAVNKVIKV